MHIRQLLGLFSFLFAVGCLQAQDIHFTQYYMSPTTLNPAMTGKFEGTVRIGGIYRGQWASVIGNKGQYTTPSLWVDAPVFRGFRKRDWLGIGLTFFTDKAGDLGLKHTATKLSGTYHLALDKKGQNLISIGGAYGQVQRSLDRKNAQFADGLLLGDPFQSADFRGLGDDVNATYSDIDGGIVLTARLNKQTDFNIGYSMFHIGKPEFTLIGQDTLSTSGQNGGAKRPLPQRSVFHGQFNVKMNDRVTFSPSFFYQTMNGADEIALQGIAGYLFNPQKDITINFGLGYRLADAMEILLGFQQKNLRVGFAYDINISSLSAATSYRGGFEIAANYIFKKYKKAIIKPQIICPRF